MPGPVLKSAEVTQDIVVLVFDLSGTELTPEQLIAWGTQLGNNDGSSSPSISAQPNTLLYARFCHNAGLEDNETTSQLYKALAEIPLRELPGFKPAACRRKLQASLGITTAAGLFAHSFKEIAKVIPLKGSSDRLPGARRWLKRYRNIVLPIVCTRPGEHKS
jgi:hypothetical protein